MGLDSDSPRAAGEVGRVGVAIDSLDDMRRSPRHSARQGLDVDEINSTASILLDSTSPSRRSRRAWEKVNGTIQNDILKEYIAAHLHLSARPSMRIITDIFAFCTERVPNWNTISISGYHIRKPARRRCRKSRSRSANGIAYVEAALASARASTSSRRGSRSSSTCTTTSSRRSPSSRRAPLWARIMRERFGAKDPRSWMLRFHSQVAGSTLTAQQPDNNVVRVTVQALAR